MCEGDLELGVCEDVQLCEWRGGDLELCVRGTYSWV